jgi:hypothetical protein
MERWQRRFEMSERRQIILTADHFTADHFDGRSLTADH